MTEILIEAGDYVGTWVIEPCVEQTPCSACEFISKPLKERTVNIARKDDLVLCDGCVGERV